MQKIPDHAITQWLAASVTPYGIVCALTELRERRKQDLTAEEREALRFACKVVGKGQSIMKMTGGEHAEYDRALAVLDKLLAGTP